MSHVLNESRSRLVAEHAEMLLFLKKKKKNCPLLLRNNPK